MSLLIAARMRCGGRTGWIAQLFLALFEVCRTRLLEFLVEAFKILLVFTKLSTAKICNFSPCNPIADVGKSP
jgi:hypothetical protein